MSDANCYVLRESKLVRKTYGDLSADFFVGCVAVNPALTSSIPFWTMDLREPSGLPPQPLLKAARQQANPRDLSCYSLPNKFAVLDHVFPGTRWRVKDQSIAFKMNVPYLLATKPGEIGGSIDPCGERVAVKCIVARVGIEFAIDLVARQRRPSVAKHRNHASVGVEDGQAPWALVHRVHA